MLETIAKRPQNGTRLPVRLSVFRKTAVRANLGRRDPPGLHRGEIVTDQSSIFRGRRTLHVTEQHQAVKTLAILSERLHRTQSVRYGVVYSLLVLANSMSLRSNSVCLVVFVVLAGLGWLGYGLFATWRGIPDAYAAWDAGTLLVEYLETQSNRSRRRSRQGR